MSIHFIFKILIAILLSSTALAGDCDSYFKKAGVQTYPYMSTSRTHALAKKLAQIYKKRSPQKHFDLDQNMTYIHSQREMTFQVKNPNTGNYDKFVDVPVNSRAVVMNTKKFNGLVQSTAPILRKLRSLLQQIYSGEEINAKNLGLENLTRENQELVLNVIRESIYLEPKLMDPSMADYPFLAVAGFDGAIGNPDKPDPRFFEMNLGTPSGLSNNILLLEALLKQDKEFRKTVGPFLPQLPKDDTFAILRETIEGNALAWTGNEDGISVVVSPGKYNGAHADVAAISKLTGMPLVNAHNLYVDEDGEVRLKSISGDNPIVTGIYGRMEESFFLQSEGLPMISPNNIDTNNRLSRDLGLELRPAASYKYVKDGDGKIVGVKRDSKGDPLFLKVWDKVGVNPNGKASPFGLVEAIKKRKLYYSAIGGRVVDDKRLFPIITEHLIPESEQDNLARPVSTLDRSEYNKLYEHPESYVVKEPNNSGGVGVYFLFEMDKLETSKLLDKVRNNPSEYEVQELRNPNTLKSYSENKRGKIVVQDVATDIRIFPMMDAEGNVRAGSNAVLFRTGPNNSFFSNTSKGGGYGVVAITRGLPSLEKPRSYYGYVIPAPERSDIALLQVRKFEKFLKSLWTMKQTLGSDTDIDLLQSELRSLSFKFRELMDLVPESVRYLPALLRYYADKPGLNASDFEEMENRLISYLWDLYIVQEKLNKSLQEKTNAFFLANGDELEKNQNYGHSRSLDDQVPDNVKLRYLNSPERFNVMTNSDGSLSEKFDIAEILKVPNSDMQKLIDELRAAGGELRLPQKVRTDTLGKKVYQDSVGGFWVNYTIPENSSYMRPTISFDVTAEPGSKEEARKLAVFSHEMEHFKFWKETYDRMVSEGIPESEAVKEAYLFVDSIENIVVSERRAIDKEIEVERRLAKKLGVKDFGYPLADTQFGYANRILYPEFEGMRRYLLNYTDKRLSKTEQVEGLIKAKELIRYQLVKAEEMRKTAVEKIRAQEGLLKRLSRRILPKKDDLYQWENTPTVDLIAFPYGVEWLLGQHTIRLFVDVYKEVLGELGIEDDFAHSKTFKALLKSGADTSDFKVEEQQQQQ